MIDIRVDADDLIVWLDHIIDGMPGAIADGLERTADVGRDVAQDKSTGSVRKGVVVSRKGRSVALVASAPWSGIVEHGRGAIQAKGDGFLRFEVAGGRVVYTKRVGPARARPFMAPAGIAMSKSVEVDRALNDLLNG